MKVLSLFDGISGGSVALSAAGINPTEYHASEIDKNAISIAMSNNPSVVQLGSVTEVRGGNYDLILAGSPCQGFSSAGKGLNFQDERSKLFFEFVRILKETRTINPNVKFMLENVRMRKEWSDIISMELGVEPMQVCASVCSPIKRNRMYWFNWENPTFSTEPAGGFYELTGGRSCAIVGRKLVGGKRADSSSVKAIQCIEVSSGDTGRCLTTVRKDSAVYTGGDTGRIIDAFGVNRSLWRNLTLQEASIAHGYPDGYFDDFPESHCMHAIGNGWSIQVVSRILEKLKEVKDEDDE